MEARIVEATGITEFEFLVEDEHVRRGQTAIRTGDELLVAVVEIIEGPVVLLRVGFHLGKGITELTVTELILAEAIRMVGIDRDQFDALGLVLVPETLEAFLNAVRGRAVVRGEQHHQHLTTGVVGELVVLAIGAWEVELWRRVTDLERADIRRVAVDKRVRSAEADAGTKDEQEDKEVSHSGGQSRGTVGASIGKQEGGRMANGEWPMANGQWRMANGEWPMANGQ